MKYIDDQHIDIKRKNPWWQAVELIENDEKLKELASLRYQYSFPELRALNTSRPGIYTIRGPRQIGKSTAMKQIIRNLLKDGVDPKSILYLSCDGLRVDRELYRIVGDYMDGAPADTMIYLLIDEVTFIDQWPRAIKELADEGRLTRAVVILTGSNMIDLKHNTELMPGRRGKSDVLDVYLLPLGFRRFLELVEPELLTLDMPGAITKLSRFRKNFSHYLSCGGIPLAINEYFSAEMVPSHIFELYRSWITGDMLKMGKSEAIFDSIIANVIKHMSSAISWYKLGKESHLASHAAAMDYIELLERMFVLNRLECIDMGSKRPVFRKNKKIYFSDPLIFDALHARSEGFSEESFGFAAQWMDDDVNMSKKVEQVVVADLCSMHDGVYYWANAEHEVDAVVKYPGGRLGCYEVKYQRRVSAKDFLWFNRSFPNQNLTVYTKQDYEREGNITCVPAALALAGIE